MESLIWLCFSIVCVFNTHSSVLREGVALTNHLWTTVKFKYPFSSVPVVIVGPPSFYGNHAVDVIICNITTASFQIALVEDSSSNVRHGQERVGYVAALPGTYVANDGTMLKFGTYALSNVGREEFVQVKFEGRPFQKTPVVVMSTIQDETDYHFLKTRHKLNNVNDVSAFYVSLEPEEKHSPWADGPKSAVVGYLAVPQSSSSVKGQRYQAGLTPQRVTETQYQISFSEPGFTNPIIIAHIATFHGKNPVGIRVDKTTTHTALVHLQEDTSLDHEQRHRAAERIGFFILSPADMKCNATEFIDYPKNLKKPLINALSKIYVKKGTSTVPPYAPYFYNGDYYLYAIQVRNMDMLSHYWMVGNDFTSSIGLMRTLDYADAPHKISRSWDVYNQSTHQYQKNGNSDWTFRSVCAYSQENHLHCVGDEISEKSFMDFDKAVEVCSSLPGCFGIYDRNCDSASAYSLCGKESQWQHSEEESCIYTKDRTISKIDKYGIYSKEYKHHCANRKLSRVAFTTFESALEACNARSQCFGIYDNNCDGSQPFYLCREESTWSISSKSCILRKPDCGPGCLRCQVPGLEECDECNLGYVLTSDSICKACANNCSSCKNTGPGSCDECNEGFTLINKKICKACPSGCHSCRADGSIMICSTCDAGHALVTKSEGSPICMPCPQNCEDCSRVGPDLRCNKCQDGYKLSGNHFACEGYKKEFHMSCHRNQLSSSTFPSYSSAISACDSDHQCFGVYDPSCDGQPLYLCGSSASWTSSNKSCVYRKNLVGLEYVGCFKDLVNNRDFPVQKHGTSHNSVEYCSLQCSDYAYFSLQFGYQCFCSNHAPHYEQVSDKECYISCSGDANTKCGGRSRNSVYMNTDFPYMGCFAGLEGSDLDFIKRDNDPMNSPHSCSQQCVGYKYFMLYSGVKCLCSNDVPRMPKPTTDCDIDCAGQMNIKCGGSNAASLYKNIEQLCNWKYVADSSIGYNSGFDVLQNYTSLLGAQNACLGMDECEGVTQLPSTNWQTRKKRELRASQGTKSYVKQCNGLTSPDVAVSLLSQYYDGNHDFQRIDRTIKDDFTISFCFRASTTCQNEGHWWKGCGLVDSEVAGYHSDFGVSFGGKRVLFGTGNPDVTVMSQKELTDSLFHHVTAVREKDTGMIMLYIDGDLQGTAVGSKNSLDASSYLDIGRLQTDKHYFRGYITNVNLYSRTFSSFQIQQFDELSKCTTPEWVSLGCWKDQQAIPSVEGNPKLDGPYKARSDALRKCYEVTLSLGYSVFGLQDSGKCMTGPNALHSYRTVESNNCNTDGEGGSDANHVYKIPHVASTVENGFNYTGTFVDWSVENSVTLCKDKCPVNPNCEFWVYNKLICFLMKDYQYKKKCDTCTSGFRSEEDCYWEYFSDSAIPQKEDSEIIQNYDQLALAQSACLELPECGGVTQISASTWQTRKSWYPTLARGQYPSWVKNCDEVRVKHRDLDCSSHCGTNGGRCEWCGVGSCCREGKQGCINKRGCSDQHCCFDDPGIGYATSYSCSTSTKLFKRQTSVCTLSECAAMCDEEIDCTGFYFESFDCVCYPLKGNVGSIEVRNSTDGCYVRTGLKADFFFFPQDDKLPDLTGRWPNLTKVELDVNVKRNWQWKDMPLQKEFAVRWRGSILVDATGDWQFELNSDDGSDLWIDGIKIVDDDGEHPMHVATGTVYLEVGAHDIRIEYFQNEGRVGCVLSWQGPKSSSYQTKMDVVPSSALLPLSTESYCSNIVPIQGMECHPGMYLATYSDVVPCKTKVCELINPYSVRYGKGIVLRGSGYGCTVSQSKWWGHNNHILCFLNNTKPKPSKVCLRWVSGDGTGGPESYLGIASSEEECIKMVLKQKPTANGVTYGGNGGRYCYAEFGMTDVSSTSLWRTCFLQNPSSLTPTTAPKKKCRWERGDGSGPWLFIGYLDSDTECINKVINQEPKANGITYSPSRHTCYAKFGMTKIVPYADLKSCYLTSYEPPTPAPTTKTRIPCLTPPRQVRAQIAGEGEIFSYPTIAEHVFSNPHPDSLLRDETLLGNGGNLTLEAIIAKDVSTNFDMGRCCGNLSNDVKGKLVICRRGDCWFIDKVGNAQRHGAKAVMIINHDGVDQIVHMASPGRNISHLRIPSVFVIDSFGDHLIDIITKHPHTRVSLFVCKIPNLKAIGYEKQLHKHCSADKLDTTPFTQFDDAVSKCSSNLDCFGIYDIVCDAEPPYYLCKSPDTWKYSQSSCILQKQSICDLTGQWSHDWSNNPTYIEQDGFRVTVTNSLAMWSPAKGSITGNKLSMFGIIGEFSQDCTNITWSNGVIWNRERCPTGFVELIGSVIGQGDLPSSPDFNTLKECANRCQKQCKSFEWSFKLKRCKLTTSEGPTSNRVDEDFFFCAKFQVTEPPTAISFDEDYIQLKTGICQNPLTRGQCQALAIDKGYTFVIDTGDQMQIAPSGCYFISPTQEHPHISLSWNGNPLSTIECSLSNVCVCSSRTQEICADLHVAAANQKFRLNPQEYQNVCDHCRNNRNRDEQMCANFCTPCQKLPSQGGITVLCHYQKCISCCQRCGECLVDCPIGDIYCKCSDDGSCDNELVCIHNMCVQPMIPDEHTPNPGDPRTRYPTRKKTLYPTPAEMITMSITFEGDYAKIIGDRKSEFLEECSAVLSSDLDLPDVTCIDVKPGSIIVMFYGYSERLTHVKDYVTIHEGIAMATFNNLKISRNPEKINNDHGKHGKHGKKARKQWMVILWVIPLFLCAVALLVFAVKFGKRKAQTVEPATAATEGVIQMQDINPTMTGMGTQFTDVRA